MHGANGSGIVSFSDDEDFRRLLRALAWSVQAINF